MRDRLAATSSAGLAFALVASAVGQVVDVPLAAFVGYVVFVWSFGGLLLFGGYAIAARGRPRLGDELRRGLAYFFLSFVGWSAVAVSTSVLPGVLVVYELLTMATTLVAIGAAYSLRPHLPSSGLSRRTRAVLLSLPVVAYFAWRFRTGAWTVTTTVAFALVVLLWLIAVFRPGVLPGVPAERR